MDDEFLDDELLESPYLISGFAVVMAWEDDEKGVLQDIALFESEEDAEVFRSKFDESFAAGRPGERLIALSVRPLPAIIPAINADD